MELTEDDLKKMSPEEIMELQKKNCIFCRIIKGEVNSRKVYEDDKVLAILDINPANPGHILLLPKEHYMILPQIPPDLIAYMFIVAKHLSEVLMKAVGATGTNIFVANGAAAGQKAPHFMIHIIPRIEGDGISVFNLPGNKINDDVLDDLRNRIFKIMDAMDKSKKPEPEVVGQIGETIKLNNSPNNDQENQNNNKENLFGKLGESEEAGKTNEKKVKSDLDSVTNLLLGK